MKAEAILWSGAAVYFTVAGIVYLIVSGDATGTVLFLVTALFGATAGGWAWRWRRLAGDRAEDIADAVMAENAREIGYFPSSSLWPLGLALGITATLYALIFGWWFLLVGVGILGISGTGFVIESMHKA